MNKRVISCIICGKEFTAEAANAKYCSMECRQKGRYQRRKDWEKETGFLEKQRKKMQNYRDKITEQERIAQEEEAKKAARNRKRQQTRRLNKLKALLIRDAEEGNPAAKMILLSQEKGNTSPEYWDAFKACELRYADSIHKKSATTVNGISIDNEEFGLAVSISIEELGRIEINTKVIEPAQAGYELPPDPKSDTKKKKPEKRPRPAEKKKRQAGQM